MKKLLILFALAIPMALAVGCGDDKDDGGTVSTEPGTGTDSGTDSGSGSTTGTVTLSLDVNNIANNKATINIYASSGKCSGAMVIDAMRMYEVTISPSNTSALIDFVKANGVSADLPHINTVTGLRADTEMLTAVIAFDEDGEVGGTKYLTWTALGDPDEWSSDNSAGDLDKVEW